MKTHLLICVVLLRHTGEHCKTCPRCSEGSL